MGLLPEAAIYTAEFVYEMDRLFDCFNSATKFNFKEVRGGISSESCHHQFISDITSYIKSWEVCAPQHVHIHCTQTLSNLIGSTQSSVARCSVLYSKVSCHSTTESRLFGKSVCQIVE